MSVSVLSGMLDNIEGRGGGMTDLGGPGDPVLAVSGPSHDGNPLPEVLGPRPERVYSHSLLLELKDHPLAKKWPPYLDTAFKNQRGVWDPDRWHLDRKRGETPVMGENKDLDVRDAGGRRDRDFRRGGGGGLDQEGDDLQQLVLSPQRRSFLGGCSSGGLGEGEVSLRPEQPGKRVGSGRILARQERERGEEGERSFRRGEEFRRIPGERRGDDKFAGFRGRDRDDDRDGRDGWGDERRRDNFYSQHDDRDRRVENREPRGLQDRHTRPRRRQNEPEWMSESITKSDVIELRGFDGSAEAGKEKVPSPPTATSTTLPISLSLGLAKPGQPHPPPGLPAGGISVEDLEREQRDSKKHVENNNQQKPVRDKNLNHQPKDINQPEETQGSNGHNLDILKSLGMSQKSQQEEKSFNYDQIMESMNLSSLLGGAPGIPDPQAHVKPAAQSRFIQLFNNSGVEQQQTQDSRRSSIQDEFVLGANILKEINGEEGPVIRIPSPTEEERYFAPISPAAQTRAITNPLLDMINKGNNQQGHHRVQELEDGIRRSLGLGGAVGHPHLGPNQQLQHQQVQDIFKAAQGQNLGQRQFQGKENRGHQDQQQDNLSAFKKLVAMVGPQQAEQRDQAVPFGPGVVRPNPLPASIPTNAPTEQEILEHMMSGGVPGLGIPRPKAPSHPVLPPALANYLATHPLNAELLARPEAEQLLVGLNTGNITVQNIVQQLSNPALQVNQRQRDLLLSVLKLKTMGAGPNPGRGGSGLPHPPMPPHLALPRTSPLPPNDPMMLLPQGGPPTRVSPLMFPHLAPPTHLSVSPSPQQARVPSPQEMTVLTQQIMQQALIKRKLEEQKENFRRRQGDSEPPISTAAAAGASVPTQPASVASMVSSGSPLAFTPTSVMRKNAAERKDSDPLTRGGAGVPEVKVTTQKEGVTGGSQPPPSPGRPITKGKEERPASLELGQSQVPPGGRRLSPQQMPPQQMFPPHLQGSLPHNNPLLYLQNNSMGPVSHSMLSQANAMAQHQMAAANFMAQGMDPRHVNTRGIPPQHLPRPQCVSPNRSRPNMAPSPQPQNQGALARFFSPEVLAQAQSGAVPAMPPMASLTNLHRQQKVLTLEEIERQAAAVRI